MRSFAACTSANALQNPSFFRLPAEPPFHMRFMRSVPAQTTVTQHNALTCGLTSRPYEKPFAAVCNVVHDHRAFNEKLRHPGSLMIWPIVLQTPLLPREVIFPASMHEWLHSSQHSGLTGQVACRAAHPRH